MAEKFIKDATTVYPTIQYDYSKVEYKNCDTIIIIGCPKDGHGYFERVPYNFLKRKLGCPVCIKEQKDIDNKSAIISQFIKDATTKHNDTYDYSKVDFTIKKNKITIICKVKGHPEFSQTVSAHLRGSGCPSCANNKIAKSKLMNIDWFRKRAYDVHGDIYDYTDTVYTKSQEHLVIKCRKPDHPPFSQIANNHLGGDGCPRCANEKSSLRQRMTTDEFLKRLSDEQKSLYEYDNVIYVSTHEPVIIKCKKCDRFFSQCPADHLSGRGCSICGRQRASNAQTFTTEQFIERALIIHQDKYSYTKVEYINSQTYIIITCPKHGDYKQVPNSHLQGAGCNQCAIELNSQKQRIDTIDFVKKCLEIPGNRDKYDYTNTMYIGMHGKITIFCKICLNEYTQYAGNHLHKHFGCGVCAGNAILTTDQFITKAKIIHSDNRFDYSMTEYIRSNQPVTIKCNVTNQIFNQTPNSHLSGSECPCCKPKYSRVQIEYLRFIEVTHPSIQHALHNGEHRIKNSRYDADGYIEEMNKIYEFHGCYWHGCPTCYNGAEINKTTKCSFEELYSKTIKKAQHCRDNGYHYSEIWECQWRRGIKAVRSIQRLFRNMMHKKANILINEN